MNIEDDEKFIQNFAEDLKKLNSSVVTLLPLNYKLEKSLTNIKSK